MRIANGENFLSIETRYLEGGHATWRVEAFAVQGDIRFSAIHDSVFCSSGELTMIELEEFGSLLRNRWELMLAETGWLRAVRDSRGHLMVSYRIASSRASAALEGAIPVDGEFSAHFCRQLKALLVG